MSDLSERLQSYSGVRNSECIALTDGNRHISYAELGDTVIAISNWLNTLNVRAIALQAENSIDWVLVDLACQEIHVICIPIPEFFSAEQVCHCLTEANVELIICRKNSNLENFNEESSNEENSDEERYGERFFLPPHLGVLSLSAFRINENANDLFSSVSQDIPKVTQRVPPTTQKITFTSGSTGNPKGVCLSLDHQWQVAQSLADSIDIDCPRHLCLLPLSTLLENVAGVYSPLLRGGTVYLLSDIDRGLSGSSGLDLPSMLACIDKVQPHSLILIPQLLLALVVSCQQGWVPPDSLKFVAVGGGKVSKQLLELSREFGIPVYQGYGLSECGSVVSLNTAASDDIQTAGEILSHCRIDIEDNEIVVSGSSYLGYLGQPDSWYPDKVYTGDKGFISDNKLTVDGRIKNILITRYGRNISPEWLEAELMATPLISACLVVGDDKPFITAILSLIDSVSDDDIDSWIDQVNRRLPDYARILSWLRVSSSDFQQFITANGRVQRERYLDAHSEVIESLYANQSLYLVKES